MWADGVDSFCNLNEIQLGGDFCGVYNWVWE